MLRDPTPQRCALCIGGATALLFAIYVAVRGPDPRLGPNPASEPHSPTTCSREGWFRGAKAEAHVDWSATREAWRRKDDASLRRFVDGIEAELDGLAAGGAVFTSTMDKRNAEFDP